MASNTISALKLSQKLRSMPDAFAAYKNIVRVRACGLLLREGNILLMQLHSPVTDQLVWMPPGGGVEFRETTRECLVREFREETGLEIKVGAFCFFNEMIHPPFHAVELFYRVFETGGVLFTGADPEYDSSSQLLKKVQWVPTKKLRHLKVAPPDLSDEIEKMQQ